MTRVIKIVVREWLMVAILLAVIAVESTNMLSSEHTGHFLQSVLSLFGIHASESLLELINHALRKCGHFTGYGLLSAATFRAVRSTAFAESELHHRPEHHTWKFSWAFAGWALATLTATADELHQMTIPSRTGVWSDVVLDSCGALVAQIIILLVVTRSRRAYEYQK